MPYTKKQVVTTLSIICLIALTAVASYATSRANNLSLPIPSSLTGFTCALPIVAGLLLEGGYDLTHRNTNRGRSAPSPPPTALYTIIANALILVYSTVVITLLGTYSAPTSSLLCGLNDRWLSLYRAKDADAIKTIQDTFKCCGLHSTVDKAWPFPDKTHGVDACEKAFGRTQSCFLSWRGAEQRMSGLLMGVVGLVVVWQLLIVAAPSRRSPWFQSILPERLQAADDEEQGNGSDPRLAISYPRTPEQYADNRITEEEEEQSENENETRNSRPSAIEAQAKDALPVGRSNGSPARAGHAENEWAEN